MEAYLALALVIRYLADCLLIFGASRLICPWDRGARAFLAASVGVAYGLLCARLPELPPVCYGLCLCLTSLAAFAGAANGKAKGVVFCLLRLGLDGLTVRAGAGWELLGAALMVLACLYGLRGKRYVPVELMCRGRRIKLQALYDTGHSLTDPVTGRAVLVVGADVAQALTGLSREQLKDPVQTMGLIPGLRLIPCKTVGSAAQLLLALQLSDTRIGRKKGSCLVAFAPQILDGKGNYQALTGGNL